MGIGKIFSTTIDDLLKSSGKAAGSTASKSASQAATQGTGFLAKVNRGFRNTPVFSAAIPIAIEVPALIEAYKNGDFGAQLGRSFCRVGMATLGGSIAMGYVPGKSGAKFLSWSNAKTTGAGLALSIGGDWVGKQIGDGIFGKSIAEQKSEMMMGQQQLQTSMVQQQQVQASMAQQQHSQIRSYLETGSWNSPGLSFSSLQPGGGGYSMGGYPPGPPYSPNPVRAF